MTEICPSTNNTFAIQEHFSSFQTTSLRCHPSFSSEIYSKLKPHRTDAQMADFSFGGTDEENVELKKLNAEVVSCYSRHFKEITDDS